MEWLLAEYRNIQTGHRQFLSVVVWTRRMDITLHERNGVLFEFVELCKKDE